MEAMLNNTNLPPGMQWSDIDIEIVNFLMNNWTPALQAAHYVLNMRNYKEDYFKAYQNNDIFGRNQARFGKVQQRNRALALSGLPAYIDTYDYTHGYDTLIFLGAHPAMVQWQINPTRHSLIKILTSHDNDFLKYKLGLDEFADYHVQYVYGGRARMVTLGGTSNFLFGTRLKGGVNMRNDINLNNKSDMHLLNYYISNNPNDPQDVKEFARNLFELTAYFNALGGNRPRYSATAMTGLNSNSWAHGLLRAAGLEETPALSGTAPGWNRIVPAGYFGQ